MRAARWLVIATAVAAAAIALHLLFEGDSAGRGGPRHSGRHAGAAARETGAADANGSGWSRERALEGATALGGGLERLPAEDQIDAESRAAMKDFLRESVEPGEGEN